MYDKEYIDRVVNSLIEIELIVDFNVVRETLTRIGISSVQRKELFQTAHILKKKNKYYIVHFKQMFGLDGREYVMTHDDKRRLNRIVSILENWGMITISDKESFDKEEIIPMNMLKIVRYGEKDDWKLTQKYPIGKYKNKENNVKVDFKPDDSVMEDVGGDVTVYFEVDGELSELLMED